MFFKIEMHGELKIYHAFLRTELIHDGSNIKTRMAQLPAMNTTQFGFVKSHLPNKPQPMGTIYQPEIAPRTIQRL